jgi:YHS domain-containing protein
MAKRVFVVLAVVSAVLVGYAVSGADEKEGEKKEFKAVCPVSGEAAKEDCFVEYKGGKVYFCCGDCPKAFKEKADKYATKANLQLYQTGQAKLVKCPIAGRALNTATAIEVGGTKVCFCCNNCKGKATAAKGAEQIELIFNDKAFAKGFEVAKKEK